MQEQEEISRNHVQTFICLSVVVVCHPFKEISLTNDNTAQHHFQFISLSSSSYTYLKHSCNNLKDEIVTYHDKRTFHKNFAISYICLY